MKDKKYLVKEEWETRFNDEKEGTYTEKYTNLDTFDTLDEARSYFKTMFVQRVTNLSYITEDDRNIGIKAVINNYDGSTDFVNVYIYEIREMRLSADTFGVDCDEVSDTKGVADKD